MNPTDETQYLMVHVTAPASLPAGYTFEAEINGDKDKVFTCEVPEGGVVEGQIFLAPLPHNFDGPRLRAPIGSWKDGLFGFFNAGFFHPSLWCALCCTQIAMGQVISRMQLTWLGEPGTLFATSRSFVVIVVLMFAYIIYSTCLELAAAPYEIGQVPSVISTLRFVGNIFFTAWAVYSLCRTRQNVRARYQIPEERCHGCEDLCCSFWCSCCVTAQMLRHTGEYETYPGVCCSKTGHPPGTPLVV